MAKGISALADTLDNPQGAFARQRQVVQPTRPIAQYFGLSGRQVFRKLFIPSHRP